MSFRFLTAGESHGPCLTGILDGVPAGLALREEDFERSLSLRQRGYGRSPRMKIEADRVEIVAGVRHGRTTGAPICLRIENKDHANWREVMATAATEAQPPRITSPRPGHADLAGSVKYGHADIRDVIERASARETAMRVAVGVVAERVLAECGMYVVGHVIRIGDAQTRADGPTRVEELRARADADDLRCVDAEASARMRDAIRDAAHAGDTLGGVFEVRVSHPPIGLGSYAQWDRRLDSLLVQALVSIPAVKAAEVGDGWAAAGERGSAVHDAIEVGDSGSIRRSTNRAGGIEGGISNGEDIVCRGAMKPLSTLRNAAGSVDLATMQPSKAVSERSDVCAVPAASIVGEAVVSIVIAKALLEKFGGDSMSELVERVASWRTRTQG